MPHNKLKFTKTKFKGFGLIEIIIIIAVILIMFWGFTNLKGQSSPQSQVDAGNADIKAAQNASNQENQDSQTLQQQVQGSQPDLSPNTYHNIENQAKKVSQ